MPPPPPPPSLSPWLPLIWHSCSGRCDTHTLSLSLSLSHVHTHLFLSIQPSAEFGSPVTGYVVEWGVVGGARHTLPHPPSPRVASLTNLSPDTQHTARVKVQYYTSLPRPLNFCVHDVFHVLLRAQSTISV